MRRFLTLTVLSLFLLSASPRDEAPDFLLITIDTWRADYLSSYGSGKVSTPFLDRLAAEGSYLKLVETPCPMTTPAHASILTGLYPNRHGIRDNSNYVLAKECFTLAEQFRKKGYATAAVLSGVPLKKRYGLDRGFDQYDDDEMEEKNQKERQLKKSLKTAREASDRALAAVSRCKGRCFLWLHLYDPHAPYTPPVEFAGKYPSDPYAGEIAYVDSILAGFFSRLMSSGRSSWEVIVVGDHGEGLGDHGEEGHGALLYNSTRTVPLIYWNSRKKCRAFGLGVKSLIDIYPTAQEIFGLENSACEGVSLFKDTEGKRFLFSETFFPLCFSANPGFSARKEGLIYIKHGTSLEVYGRSFVEGPNLYSGKGGFVREAEEQLDKYSGKGGFSSPTMRLSTEEMKMLASLGYIGSFSGDADKITKCDLRELVKDYGDFLKNNLDTFRGGNYEALLGGYDKLLKKYPYSPMLHCDKSAILINMRRFKQAVEECKVCVMLNPNNSRAHSNLGNLAAMEGRFREAERYYNRALELDVKDAVTHLNLGLIYYEKLKEETKALKHLKTFVELAPDHPRKADARQIIRKIEGSEK